MVKDVEGIIKQVLAGQREAYAELIRRYQQEVWGVVAYMLNDIKSTEEKVQDVFVTAYMKLDTFRAGGDFGRWIKAVARNMVREEMRFNIREKRRLKTYYTLVTERFNDPAAAESRDASFKEALQRCREKLDRASVMVLELRYRESLSFNDIAHKLGRSIGATRKMLSRIRLMLRACIQEGIELT
ncbi:RNA polymerase sigma factor [Planctomycetota bacterium]